MEQKLRDNLKRLISKEMEDKWFNMFSKQAGYAGNGVYTICNLYSTDTRELFLMFIAQQEQIPFENE